MAQGGKKYRLVLYEHMINRWWPATLWLALIPLANVGVLWGAQLYFTNPADNPLPALPDQTAMILLAVSGLAFVFTAALLIARGLAYVQLFPDHMLLATPFMRLKVSYKRIVRITTSQVGMLYPPKSMSGNDREIIAPISSLTAIVVHLTSYPMPRKSIEAFLSRFFFYDQTPHFVLIVDDWMKFSMELESRRVSGSVPRRPPHPHHTTRTSGSGLLDDLKNRR
jgi:hypothetical protein